MIDPEKLADQDLECTEKADASVSPLDEANRRHRNKKLVMVASLLILLLAAGGGHWLLGEQKVEIKTVPRPADKITSGNDLQKAAYDSLKGLLGAPEVASTPSATVSPAPTTGRSESTQPSLPLQRGIAMTVTPPERVEEARQRADSTPRDESPAQQTSPPIEGAAKPKVGSSLTLASIPRPAVAREKEENVTPLSIGGSAAQPTLIKETNPPPKFGTMLPVRLMGVLYTLRPGSLVRLELARDIRMERRTLKRGTVFIGNLLGGDLDRAFVQIKGYIDPDSEALVQMEGDLLGNDGGAGLRGKRRRIASAWGRALDRVAQSGTQILSGILGRRDASVIVATDPYGSYREMNGGAPADDNRSFVEVPAGEVGFILVTTLPGDDHIARQSDAEAPPISMPDGELARLLTEANPSEIRSALPRMNPELRRIAEQMLTNIDPVMPE
jgi:hypothetical protein